MKGFKNYIFENFKYLLIPPFIFLGTFAVEPFFSIDANESTKPYYQSLYVIFTLLFYSPKKLIIKSNFGFLTISVFVITLYSIFISDAIFSDKISFFVVLVFAKLISDIRNFDKYYNKILSVFISYLVVSVIIFTYRLIIYDFDYLRVRGGANIWGGNPLIMINYLFIAFQVIIGRKNKEIFRFSLIALILSVIFISRIGIITSIILLTIIFYEQLKINFFRNLIFLILTFYFLENYFFNSALFESVNYRYLSFESYQYDGALDLLKITSAERYFLWNLVFQILQDNFMGIGIDTFKNFSIFSTPHNLLLNNLIEAGYIFGMLLNFILLFILFKIAKLKTNLKNKIIAFFSYFSFLLVATVSGSKMIQASGYTSSFTLIFIFCLLNTIMFLKLSKHKKNIDVQ